MSVEPSSEFQSLSDRIFSLETAVEEAAASRRIQIAQLRQHFEELKQAQISQTNIMAELLDLFDSAKHAVKFIVLAGKAAVWITKVGAALVAIWLVVKGFGSYLFGGHRP